MFGATVSLIEKWKISRLDVADYLACADRNAWAPLSFDPPSLDIANAAYSGGTHGGHGGRSNTGMQVQKERTYLVIESDRSVVAVRPTTMTGYFFQEFELRNYPFDSQVLCVPILSLSPIPLFVLLQQPQINEVVWRKPTSPFDSETHACHFLFAHTQSSHVSAF
jgi:hypothetical protein